MKLDCRHIINCKGKVLNVKPYLIFRNRKLGCLNTSAVMVCLLCADCRNGGLLVWMTDCQALFCVEDASHWCVGLDPSVIGCKVRGIPVLEPAL